MARKRTNGEGTIRQRADGRWEAQYIAGLRPDGRPVRRSIYGKTQGEVAKKLLEVRGQIANGQHIEPVQMTVSDWLDIWFNEYVLPSKKASTAASYEDSIRLHIKPYLGGYKLQKLRPDEVQAGFNKLAQAHYSPATIIKARTILRAALKRAVRNRLILTNPCEDIEIPKAEQEEVRYFSLEEQKRFLAALPDNTMGRALAFILGTGLRASECCGLRWSDIRRDELTVAQTIRRNRNYGEGSKKTKLIKSTPKTRAGARSIPLSPRLREILAAQRREQRIMRMKCGPNWNDNDLVFTTALGSPLEGRNLTRALHAVLDKAGIERLGVHALRHTFATRAVESGMDYRTLSEILGHSRVAITMQLYVHSSKETKRKAMDAMDQFL
jgi:integrase